MRVKFIVSVEALATEAAFRMSFEPALIYGSRVVIAEFFMLL